MKRYLITGVLLSFLITAKTFGHTHTIINDTDNLIFVQMGSAGFVIKKYLIPHETVQAPTTLCIEDIVVNPLFTSPPAQEGVWAHSGLWASSLWGTGVDIPFTANRCRSRTTTVTKVGNKLAITLSP